jgi:hypothetical protein
MQPGPRKQLQQTYSWHYGQHDHDLPLYLRAQRGLSSVRQSPKCNQEQSYRDDLKHNIAEETRSCATTQKESSDEEARSQQP